MEETEESSLGETVDHIRGMLVRGRWWILGSACSVALVTAALVSRLPDRYSSEAVLVVRQQQISQRYVEPTNATTVSDTLKAIMQEVLSRNRLLGIIDEFGLYAKARKLLPADELVDLMRKDILIEPLDEVRGNFSAFKISFNTDTARQAQLVTSRLTSLFIEENLKTRGNQAAATTTFLTEQLEAAKQKLKEQDERRGAFKMQYLGELPERQAATLGIVSEARSQLMTVTGNLSRVQQQRMTLGSSLGENLTRLQSEKAKLLTHFTLRHPDVIKKDQEIEKVAILVDRLTKGTRGSGGITPDDPSLRLLQSQVEANDLEMENLSKEERRLKAEIAQNQAHLNLTPIREQQLADILRDYDQYAQTVRDLQTKLIQAQQTTSVEDHQEGQQFRLVDPPTLPVFPASPKRLKLDLSGLGAGIAIGLVLAFLTDLRNQSFHSEKSLSRRFTLPLVLSVPALLTPDEERSRKWKIALECLAGSVLLLTVCAAEVYVYRYR